MIVWINRGMNNTVSEDPKMIVEKARLSTQIQDLECDKDKMLLMMGKLRPNGLTQITKDYIDGGEDALFDLCF